MIIKAELRQSIRERLDFSTEERAAKSHRLCEAITSSEAWCKAMTIGIFAAQSTEPDVDLLWPAACGKRLCYPRVFATDLQFYHVEHSAELVVGRWGLREPDPCQATLISLAEIDLLLVPGVAFTGAGARLGRGGGYYDRLLADSRLLAPRFGVCFDLQIVTSLPTEPHDQAVDRVVTESGFH
jgi:5-formyltetrahydrofolate cyclo-ligase